MLTLLFFNIGDDLRCGYQLIILQAFNVFAFPGLSGRDVGAPNAVIF